MKHLNDDVSSVALRFSSKLDFPISSPLQLIKLYQKGRKKLPRHCERFAALTDRSYQQASSETVAVYKASLIQGKKLVDLTAGLGVDDLAFSKCFTQVDAFDRDEGLNAIARYNLKLFGVSNVQRKTGNAEDISLNGYDWVYLDPDRRLEERRVVSLQEMQPDVRKILPQAKAAGCQVALKLSPLFEIKQILRELEDVQAIHVISEQREVKEVLVLIGVAGDETELVVTDLGAKGYELRASTANWGQQVESTDEDTPFLFIPHAALIKSHLEGYYAKSFEMKKFPDFPIYHSTSALTAPGFRTFEVLDRISAGKRQIQNLLQRHGLAQVNLILKGSSENPAQWLAKHKLKEGGSLYLVVLYGKVNQAMLCTLLL